MLFLEGLFRIIFTLISIAFVLWMGSILAATINIIRSSILKSLYIKTYEDQLTTAIRDYTEYAEMIHENLVLFGYDHEYYDAYIVTQRSIKIRFENITSLINLNKYQPIKTEFEASRIYNQILSLHRELLLKWKIKNDLHTTVINLKKKHKVN